MRWTRNQLRPGVEAMLRVRRPSQFQVCVCDPAVENGVCHPFRREGTRASTSRSSGEAHPAGDFTRTDRAGPRSLLNEQAALKCLYLTTRSLDPTGNGKARWAARLKPALNAFAVTFEGRIPTR